MRSEVFTKLWDDILRDGVERGASDLHLEPSGNGGGRGFRLRLRVAGELYMAREFVAGAKWAPLGRRTGLTGSDGAPRRRPSGAHFA